MTEPLGERDAVLAALTASVYGLIGELDDETRRYAALAADAGEQARFFLLPDGTARVEFAGIVLGRVYIEKSDQ